MVHVLFTICRIGGLHFAEKKVLVLKLKCFSMILRCVSLQTHEVNVCMKQGYTTIKICSTKESKFSCIRLL